MKNISKTIAVVAVLALANTAMAFDPFAFAGITTSGSSSSSYSEASQSESQAQSQSQTATGGSSSSISVSNDINQNSTIVGDNNTVYQDATVSTDIDIEYGT